jgi:hypothetical protein
MQTLNRIDLVGDQAMCLPMDGLGRLRVRSLNKAEDHVWNGRDGLAVGALGVGGDASRAYTLKEQSRLSL